MATYTTTLASRDTKGRIACNGFREYHRIDRKGKCVDCGYQHDPAPATVRGTIEVFGRIHDRLNKSAK